MEAYTFKKELVDKIKTFLEVHSTVWDEEDQEEYNDPDAEEILQKINGEIYEQDHLRGVQK